MAVLDLGLKLLLPGACALAVGWRYWLIRSRDTDLQAIRTLLRREDLWQVEISRSTLPCRYWIKGQRMAACFARIYVVTVEAPDGRTRILHLAFGLARRGASPALLDLA